MSSQSVPIADVLIIGAGPVGLFAIFQCGFLGLSCAVIDTLPEIGGQCVALYPDKPIYDIPAFPEISGRGLIDLLQKQIQPFVPKFYLGQTAISLTQTDNKIFQVTTDKHQILQAKVILIAAGGGNFVPNRPPLPDIQDYEMSGGVCYSLASLKAIERKHITIAGGGDSAVDWALTLCDNKAHVTLIHRRDSFRAAPAMQEKLHQYAVAGKLTLLTGWQLQKLAGCNKQLQSVIVTNQQGQHQAIKTDILLPCFGLTHDLSLLKDWQITYHQKSIPVQEASMATSRTGIFAIGDIVDYPGKLKLILTGFSEAAVAAHAIRAYLYPARNFTHQHSTTVGICPL